MQDSKISMHDLALPCPAFDTDDGDDDGSSPCHFFLVSHHSLRDNPHFYSPRSQSYLSKTKHNQMHEDEKMEMIRWSGRRASPLPRKTHKRETWNSSLRIPEINSPLVAPTNQNAELRNREWLVEQRAWSSARFCCCCWEKWTLVTFVFFTCLALHNSNICLMLAAADDIRSIIKCVQSKIIPLGLVLNSGKQKQEE